MNDRTATKEPTNPGRFIVGMPRAGTTAIIRALSLDPEVAAFGETLFFGRNWIEPDQNGHLDQSAIERHAERFATLKLDPAGTSGLWPERTSVSDDIAEAMRRTTAPCSPDVLFQAITDTVLSLTGRKFWVEKTPHHMMYLDRMLGYFPDARFVVMIRSPAAFLQSYKQQGDRKSPEARRLFHRIYHPAMASLVARRTYEAAERADRYEQVFLVRLEDLASAPEIWLPRVREHLKLPDVTSASFAKDNSSFADGRVEQRPLSNAECAWLRKITGPAAARLGYDVGSLQGSTRALAMSGATLPWWGIRNARTLTKLDQGGIRSLIKRWMR